MLSPSSFFFADFIDLVKEKTDHIKEISEINTITIKMNLSPNAIFLKKRFDLCHISNYIKVVTKRISYVNNNNGKIKRGVLVVRCSIYIWIFVVGNLPNHYRSI